MLEPKKTCTICKQEKELNQFNKKKTSKDGHQNLCRDCSNKKSRNYYSANADKQKKAVGARRNKVIQLVRQYVFDYAKKHGCIDCGENNPACLDFDHVRGIKRNNISKMANGTSLESVRLEIEKCVIRCANCHRKKTAKDFNWYKNINTGDPTKLNYEQICDFRNLHQSL